MEAQSLAPTIVLRLNSAERKPRSLWSDAWLKFLQRRTAVLGIAILVFFGTATILGPLLYRTDVNTLDMINARLAPSLEHPFGTNHLGQDQFHRALIGGGLSMTVGLTAMLVSVTLGTLVGALAGYFGGRVDSWLIRLTDLFLSLPVLPVLLMTIYLFRDPLRALLGPQPGMFLLIVLVIGAFNWMPLARLVRASFLSLKQKEFVEAAHSVGTPTLRLIVRHILPNALSPVIVAATLGVGSAIVTESTLSFLGLGFPPDFPTWGRMLYEAQDYLDLSPHIAIFPGLLIFLTVLSINYVGDGLRDALDPRSLTKI